MESLTELWMLHPGRFALAARFRSMIGEEAPPRGAALPSSSGDVKDGALLQGPDARLAAHHWLEMALGTLPCSEVPAAVDWLLQTGLREELEDSVQRLLRARVGGRDDLRLPWIPIESDMWWVEIESRPGIVAFDYALALEFLICGYTTRVLDRAEFWKGIHTVLGEITRTFKDWSGYTRSFQVGALILASPFRFLKEPVQVGHDVFGADRELVAWPTAALLADVDVGESAEVVASGSTGRLRVAGMAFEGWAVPGPLWTERHSEHVRAVTWPFLASALGLVLLVQAGQLEPMWYIAPLVIFGVLGYRYWRGCLHLWLANREISRTRRVRVFHGTTPPEGAFNVGRLALQRAKLDVPLDGAPHTLVLCPERDVAVAIDDTFLAFPEPVTVVPVVTPTECDESTSESSATMDLRPGASLRRKLHPAEREQLRSLVDAEWSLVTSSGLAALLVAGVSLAFVALVPWNPAVVANLLLVLLGVVLIYNLGTWWIRDRALRPLRRDLDEATVLVECFGSPPTEASGRAETAWKAEFLPHSGRLWTDRDREAEWRL